MNHLNVATLAIEPPGSHLGVNGTPLVVRGGCGFLRHCGRHLRRHLGRDGRILFTVGEETTGDLRLNARTATPVRSAGQRRFPSGGRDRVQHLQELSAERERHVGSAGSYRPASKGRMKPMKARTLAALGVLLVYQGMPPGVAHAQVGTGLSVTPTCTATAAVGGPVTCNITIVNANV